MSAPRVASRILAVGGTDPLCGAGIVIDAAAIADRGCAPLAVVSALVTQDSHGVADFEPVPLDGFIARLQRALRDGEPGAVKTGALGTAEHVAALSGVLDDVAPSLPVVVDPVLRGGGGSEGTLEVAGLVGSLRDFASRPRALVTPNAPELARLLDATVDDVARDAESLRDAAVALAVSLDCAVLAKGGHLLRDVGVDWLVEGERQHRLEPLSTHGGDIHGTGCWLASAIAAGLGRGATLARAVEAARSSLHRARRRAARVGAGRPQLLTGGVR